MEKIYIKDLHSHIGEKVKIAGWVDTRRDHGKLIFIDIRDGGGYIQSVIASNNEDAHKTAEKLRSEWVVSVSGEVKERPEKMVNPDLSNGDIEFKIESIEILNNAEELPFEKDTDLNFDTYLDYLPITLRSEESRAIFRVQACLAQGFREFLIKKGFTEIQAPKLVGDDAEGGGNVFPVEYFHEKRAYLATSPQLYKQIMVGVFERVFTTGNVFRAEKHSTTRHLNEYTSLDFEMGFINDHKDIMDLEGEMMKYIVEKVKNERFTDFEFLKAEIPKVPEEIPKIKLKDAQKILKEKYGEDCENEPDLEPKHEKQLSEYAKEEYDSDFLFVTHYPMEKRPMYTYEDEKDQGYSKSFDLLCRGLEVTTGGQRHHEYEKLVEGMKKKGLKPESFSFYLQAFKYGMPPHGGIGMGLERLTARFLGIENVKKATLFPREINRIDSLLSTPDKKQEE